MWKAVPALEQALDDRGQVIDVDRLHAPGSRPEPDRQRCRGEGGEQLRAPAAGAENERGPQHTPVQPLARRIERGEVVVSGALAEVVTGDGARVGAKG